MNGVLGDHRPQLRFRRPDAFGVLRQVLRGTTGRGGECKRAGEPPSAGREQYSYRGSRSSPRSRKPALRMLQRERNCAALKSQSVHETRSWSGSQGGVIREHRRHRVGVVARSSFPRYEAILLYYIEQFRLPFAKDSILSLVGIV